MPSPTTTDLPPSFDPERLEANLLALAAGNPGLAERLAWPAGNGHVRFEADGAALLRYRRSWNRLDLAGAARRGQVLREAPAERGGLLVGFGLGEMLEAALSEPDSASWVAWERDPWLARLALARYDLREALSSGRLTLALGADFVELARARARDAGEPNCSIRAHPLLGSIYTSELDALRRGSVGPVALVAEGELFVDQVRRALHRRGFLPVPVDLERLSLEELEHTVDAVRPELLLAINYTHGLAEFCEARKLPWIAWEVDPSTDRLAELPEPTRFGHVFTYARSHVDEFRSCGFASVQALPLAADVHERAPWDTYGPERKPYEVPVAFVGASMVSSGRALFERLSKRAAAAGLEGARPRFEAWLHKQRQAPMAYRIPAWIEREWPELEPALAAVGDLSARAALGEVAASEKRLGLLAGLGEFEPSVWGDEGWKLLESVGVTWRGGAKHRTELPRIYSSAAINLDVGRLYQSEIVTMRVFDVLACGGFCLTEANGEVASLFEIGSELDVYETPGELHEKVRWWLDHPRERARVAARGREAVLARHTIDQRLDGMLERALPTRVRVA